MKVKNSHILAIGCLLIAGVAYAGNQYNWGTSTGSSWVTPDDTAVSAGQVLAIGTSGGAQVNVANSISEGSSTVAQTTSTVSGNSVGTYTTALLLGSTPALEGSALCATTGSNGTAVVQVCPATGGLGSWVGIAKVAASTGSVVNVYFNGYVLALTTGTVNPGDVLATSSLSAGYLSTTSSATANAAMGVSFAAGTTAGGLTKIRLK